MKSDDILQRKIKEFSPAGDMDNLDPNSPILEYSEEFLDMESVSEKSVKFLDVKSELSSDQESAEYLDQETNENSDLESENVSDRESEEILDRKSEECLNKESAESSDQESIEFIYQESDQSSNESSDIPTYLECDNTDSSEDCNYIQPSRNEFDMHDDTNDTYMVVVSDKNKTEKFHCEICTLSFSDKREISEHLPLHRSCRECEICNNIMDINAYNIHMKLHKECYEQRIAKNKVQCKKCGKTVDKFYLKFHMLRHGSSQDQFSRMKECPVCTKYVNYYYFNNHMKRIHPYSQENTSKETQYHEACPICDRKVQITKIKKHIASHGKSKSKQYVCEQCGKVLKYHSAFQTHLLTHTGNLKYKCQFCPYRGLHLGLLKIHVRTHTKDYPYECTLCSKKFITKSNLSQHERRKHRPPGFSCSKCERKFSNKRALDVHINVIHLNIRDEKCSVCGKAFGTRDAVKAHEKKIHKIGPRPQSFRGRTANYLKAENSNQNMQAEK